VEKVELFDEFYNKKLNKKSMTFRVNYRHMDRSLTNEEVDEIQVKVRQELVQKLKITLR
jgi:phenylalanyl-tRNA synthetase alpha chain